MHKYVQGRIRAIVGKNNTNVVGFSGFFYTLPIVLPILYASPLTSLQLLGRGKNILQRDSPKP